MTGTGAIVLRKVHFPGWYGDSLLHSSPTLAACVRVEPVWLKMKRPLIFVLGDGFLSGL